MYRDTVIFIHIRHSETVMIACDLFTYKMGVKALRVIKDCRFYQTLLTLAAAAARIMAEHADRRCSA